MSRYETFVIRLWMEDDVGLDHGEVRHVGSGTGRRFRQVDEALEFVRTVASRTSLLPGEDRWDLEIERLASDLDTDA